MLFDNSHGKECAFLSVTQLAKFQQVLQKTRQNAIHNQLKNRHFVI